jgi:uncharacterized membrane protein YvlD (DUF360 family)
LLVEDKEIKLTKNIDIVKTTPQVSELTPPNITPSVSTTINGILVLLPLSLFLLGLFTGVINP